MIQSVTVCGKRGELNHFENKNRMNFAKRIKNLKNEKNLYENLFKRNHPDKNGEKMKINKVINCKSRIYNRLKNQPFTFHQNKIRKKISNNF